MNQAIAEKGRVRAEVVEKLTFSVVIAWVNPIELLIPGLEAMLNQSRKPDEILVATRHPDALRSMLAAQFPQIRILVSGSDATIPALRSLAMKQATGSVVLVTEDHCVPAENWIEVAERSLASGNQVCGGPVENACTSRMRDWAAFLTEYAPFLRPTSADVTNPLPGNNIAYRREWTPALCRALDREVWESFGYDEIQKAGAEFKFEKDMVVFHRRPFDFGYFLKQRFLFCRSYAGMRLQSFSLVHRLVYGCGSFLLVPMLMWRTWGQLSLRGRLQGRYLACLPLIAMYFTAGAIGETFGYFFGGGTSLQGVE